MELGSELISSDIIAFYELIKNGFDAGTSNGVEVKFDIVLPRHTYLRLRQAIAAGGSIDDHTCAITAALLHGASDAARSGMIDAVSRVTERQGLLQALDAAQAQFNTIRVIDRGAGMSLADINENFLVIGTPSRKREVEAALARGDDTAPFLGEKGIGRLSAMRLGERLRLETARSSDSTMNELSIDWRAFADMDAMLDQIPVEPSVGGPKPSASWSGTSVIVGDLVEEWNFSRVKAMCDYDFATLTDPFESSKRPRIAVFFNGERLAIPTMPLSLLESAHAKVVGRYEILDGRPLLTCTVDVVDLGFEHPVETQTVSLAVEDLQGAIVGRDHEIEDNALETVGPFSFEAYWYNRRRLSRVDATGEGRAVRELQELWSGILLYRDLFRVFPYGEDEDDWLELDRRALRRSGYTLNKTQFIGRVNISRTNNRGLVDQTNREGLRVTSEQRVLLGVMRYAIQDRLGLFMRDVEKQYKSQKVDLSDAKTQVKGLEDRAKSAIRQLRRVTTQEGSEAIEQLQQTLLEFTDFAAKARARIAEVETESRQMVEMAGVGLMVEVVAHELARASENSVKALDALSRRNVPEEIRAHLSTLRSEMKSISKRVRILDPMSVSGRQRRETFLLDDLIRELVDAHEAQFKRHGVEIRLDLGSQPLRVKAVRGMVVQILENLISNSIYWMEMRAERDPGYQPLITLTLESGPPTLTFEDNGRGISKANRDKVFGAFFSLKESARRRGLGLFIAQDAAVHHDGTLTLSDHVNEETGRLHRFVLELPWGAQV